MREVVIVEAVRTPLGRRNGGLSTMHSIDLLGAVQQELFTRTGLDPLEVGQVVGGCVGQIGMQSMNVTRNAWLAAGLPLEVASTTVDSQCGSSQQATNLAYSLVASGVVDVAVGCGVESMSRVPLGSTTRDQTLGKPINRRYWAHHEFTSQFEGSERIADQWGVTRADCDEFGKLSQDRAAAAWAEDRFGSQILPIDAPDLGEDGKPLDTTHRVERDECLRETSLEALAGLKPTGRPDGVHTAGTSSQICDGAGAVLLMTREKAEALGLRPRATIVDVCLVGSDPALMLTGPIPATRKLLADRGLSIDDIDVVEINEAFASVVLVWERELKADPERVNPNGGAIALGHPLGGTGAILITKALHELERTDTEHAVITMCCGGGLGTGTLLRRA
ncbi:MAG TPA: steroid 3-ketoacyl-CoA thiolase [Acidimicrobiia bacterium]|nr:steroid 3-ketoacyl-CoA thiolase [Acidimicrobiia bacterium]